VARQLNSVGESSPAWGGEYIIDRLILVLATAIGIVINNAGIVNIRTKARAIALVSLLFDTFFIFHSSPSRYFVGNF
jgi:hypothetical protein